MKVLTPAEFIEFYRVESKRYNTLADCVSRKPSVVTRHVLTDQITTVFLPMGLPT
jgi:hypothetical protein